MVTYEYESKFKNHTSVTWIVISHGGTFSWDSTDHEYKSTASDFFLQGADFVSESVILDEKLCSEDNLKFGLCEAAYFSIQIKNITDVPNLKDEMIDVYFYFDNDPETLFRVGTYKVDTDKYSADRQLRTLDCYDLLYYLWDYDITEWYYGSKSVQSVYSDGQAHTMSDLITDLFDYLQDEGVEISLKANQTLINGTYTIPKNIETDTLTFGFWIQPVLEANAAFGNINRDGEFEWIVLEWYDKAPKRVLNDYNRRPPTPYEDKATWGIGQIDVYNRDNNKIFTYRNSSKKRPSKYSIVDSFVFDGREPDDANVMTLLTNMHDAIWHTNYRTYEAQTYGDLCLEVGDRIDVYFDTDEPTEHRIRSYVLERHFTGLNALRDSYSARGDLKQPNYSVNGNWHSGDSVSGNSGNSGAYELDTEHDRHLIQVLRNGGYRFLDEPSDVAIYYDSANMQMKFKWTDPDDITDYKPLPCEWVGTVIIRKENERPLHRWDGTLIVRSTTRDEYSEDWYIDDTIEANKKYYYAIMPYYIALDDNDHPIRHYTWTKVIILNTQITISAPEITNLEVDGTSVEVTFTIPTLDSGTYTSLKLVAKKGGIPNSKTDGDVIDDITASQTSATVTGLDAESHYYFVIFTEDDQGNTASSDPADINTVEYHYVTKTLEEVMEHPISQYDTLSVTNIYDFPYSSVDGDNAFWGGSDKRVLQYNASDGYYYYEFRQANYNSADSAIAIAIQRQYIKNVTFKSGIFQTTSHLSCAFGFSPADTLTETGDNRFWCNYNHSSIQTINVPNMGTYYEFTVDVNGYADYLVFYGISGEWRMKDCELVVREE